MKDGEREYEYFLTVWKKDYKKELKKLLGGKLPSSFDSENIQVDLTMTAKEAAIEYIRGYRT